MAVDLLETKQHAHQLLDQLGPDQVVAVAQLLEVMVHEEVVDDQLSEADRRSVAASREYFEKGGEGLTFEQVVADSGFTLDEVRGSFKGD